MNRISKFVLCHYGSQIYGEAHRTTVFQTQIQRLLMDER